MWAVVNGYHYYSNLLLGRRVALSYTQSVSGLLGQNMLRVLSVCLSVGLSSVLNVMAVTGRGRGELGRFTAHNPVRLRFGQSESTQLG